MRSCVARVLHLTGADLHGTTYDATTRWPAGGKPPGVTRKPPKEPMVGAAYYGSTPGAHLSIGSGGELQLMTCTLKDSLALSGLLPFVASSLIGPTHA